MPGAFRVGKSWRIPADIFDKLQAQARARARARTPDNADKVLDYVAESRAQVWKGGPGARTAGRLS